jgi:hypothetical protein
MCGRQVLPAGILPPSGAAPYVFTVTVRKRGRSPASAALPVTLRATVIPTVSTVLSVESDGAAAGANGAVTVNSNGKLVLDGHCEPPPGGVPVNAAGLVWSFDPGLGGSGTARTVQATGGMVATLRVIVGGGSVLLLPGQRYVASLRCTLPCADMDDGCEVVGSASMTVVVNRPPAGGLIVMERASCTYKHIIAAARSTDRLKQGNGPFTARGLTASLPPAKPSSKLLVSLLSLAV